MFPMCWKCARAITKVKTEDRFGQIPHTAYELAGCKDNPEIKSFADAQVMCPIIQDKDSQDTPNEE